MWSWVADRQEEGSGLVSCNMVRRIGAKGSPEMRYWEWKSRAAMGRDGMEMSSQLLAAMAQQDKVRHLAAGLPTLPS